MKKLFNSLASVKSFAPVLLAMGLWLAGNSLISLQPVQGQEMTKAYRACLSADTTFAASNGICSVRIAGQCGTGICEGYIIHNTKCGQAVGPESSKDECDQTVPGTVKKDYYSARCIPDPTWICGCPSSFSSYSYGNTQSDPNGLICAFVA